MNITSITVSYNRTQNLENYSNVRPGLTLTAELDEFDDPDDIRQQLLCQARGFVEEACDQALEAEGQAAKFSNEPRFTVWSVAARYSHRTERLIPPEPLIIITSDAIPLAPQEAGRNWAASLRHGLRVGRAREVAVAEAHKRLVRLIDCSDGNLGRIPPWAIAPVSEPTPEAAPEPIPFDEADEGNDEAPF